LTAFEEFLAATVLYTKRHGSLRHRNVGRCRMFVSNYDKIRNAFFKNRFGNQRAK